MGIEHDFHLLYFCRNGWWFLTGAGPDSDDPVAMTLSVSNDGRSWREIWWPSWNWQETRSESGQRVIARVIQATWPTSRDRLHLERFDMGLPWFAYLIPVVHLISMAVRANTAATNTARP